MERRLDEQNDVTLYLDGREIGRLQSITMNETRYNNPTIMAMQATFTPRRIETERYTGIHMKPMPMVDMKTIDETYGSPKMLLGDFTKLEFAGREFSSEELQKHFSKVFMNPPKYNEMNNEELASRLLKQGEF